MLVGFFQVGGLKWFLGEDVLETFNFRDYFLKNFEEGGFFLVLFKRRFISRNCNKFEEEESLVQMRLVVVKMI